MIKAISRGGKIQSIRASGADANELFKQLTGTKTNGVATLEGQLEKGETGQLPAELTPPAKPWLTIDDLTDRQFDVLCLVGGGRSNSEIAFELKISEHTAKFHVNEFFKVFKVHNRVDLTTSALRLQIVTLNDYPTVTP